MERLRERIAWLASHSAERASKNKPHAFHPRVAQIWFNAWNYVETNLWASLVTHIFESLHRDFVPNDQEEKKQWERLLRRLDKESTLREEARGELQIAEEGLIEARRDQRTQQTRVKNAVDAIWETLKEMDPKRTSEIEHALNVEDLREVRDSLIRRRDDATALLERLPLFRRTMVRGLSSLRSVGWLAGVFVVATIVLAAINECAPEFWKGFGQTVTTVIGTIGGLATWLGSAFKKANSVVNTIQKTEQTLHDKLTRGAINDKELRDAEQAVAIATQRVEEHEEEIGALQREVVDLQPSRRLTGFLASRAESSDYRRHLGLPAIIRRDFEHLQTLMDQMNTEPFEIGLRATNALKEGGRVPNILLKALQHPERRLFMSEKAIVAKSSGRWIISEPGVDFTVNISDDGECRIEWNRLKIDRVVRYIDDLDRCPSDRVVDVLQAIRLLLDFKLFVVVVGVDARWVTQALQSRHEKQWSNNTKDDVTSLGRSRAAEPQDFLEKIFQIPFWLEPLEKEATQRYLRGLTGQTEDTKGKAESERSVVSVGGDSDEGSDDGESVEKGATGKLSSTMSPAEESAEAAPPGRLGMGTFICWSSSVVLVSS